MQASLKKASDTWVFQHGLMCAYCHAGFEMLCLQVGPVVHPWLAGPLLSERLHLACLICTGRLCAAFWFVLGCEASASHTSSDKVPLPAGYLVCSLMHSFSSHCMYTHSPTYALAGLLAYLHTHSCACALTCSLIQPLRCDAKPFHFQIVMRSPAENVAFMK